MEIKTKSSKSHSELLQLQVAVDMTTSKIKETQILLCTHLQTMTCNSVLQRMNLSNRHIMS